MKSARTLLSLASLFGCVLLLVTGCRPDDAPAPVVNPIERGRLLSVERLAAFDSLAIDSIIDSVDPFLSLFFAKRYDVVLYKVAYVSEDQFGNSAAISGAVALPLARNGNAPEAASVVGYSHGTVLHKDGVPSREAGDVVIGLLLATDGYAVGLTDYLGLGDSPVFHPYSHAKTQAVAVVDMLRATRILAEDNELELNGQVFLTGYSQGGHATMAAQREIELYHSDEFRLVGSAPMAGAYDISGVQEQYLLAFDPYPTPGYLPYILYGYAEVYDYLPAPKSVLKPPYDSIVDANMNQVTTMGQLNDLCNPVPRLMLLDSVMDAYENDPNHPLKIALRDNDLHLGWVPQSNLRMYYCEGDDQVSYENSIVALDAFRAAGAPAVSAQRIDTDGNLLDHNDCAPNCLLAGKLWFDSLRATN